MGGKPHNLRNMQGNIWFYVVIPALLMLLAACGGNTGSATPTVTPTVASTPSPTPTVASTPTPTTAANTGPSQTVTITQASGSYAFDPTMLTITVGTTVTWRNLTGAPHTVTSDDGKTFDSGADKPLSPGGTFSFKFTKPGTYSYHCQFHSSMVAKIVVQ